MSETTFVYRAFTKHLFAAWVHDPSYDVTVGRSFAAALFTDAYAPAVTDTYADLPHQAMLGQQALAVSFRAFDLYIEEDLSFSIPTGRRPCSLVVLCIKPDPLLIYNMSWSPRPMGTYGSSVTVTFPKQTCLINTSHAWEDALCVRELLEEGRLGR
jgi:hypothetical protein